MPAEGSDGGHGRGKTVVLLDEPEVGGQTKGIAVAEDGLVVDLEEIHPDEEGEDVLVGLASDPDILQVSSAQLKCTGHSHPPPSA